jgi:hypothetical protein
MLAGGRAAPGRKPISRLSNTEDHDLWLQYWVGAGLHSEAFRQA